jgi:hypothetical protein
MIFGFDALGFHPDLVYVVALWVPVLASAAVAELLSWRAVYSRPSSLPFVERIRREISPLAPLLRLRSVIRPVARVGR